MKAPLSKEIARVIRNSEKARALAKAVLHSRENNGEIVVTIDGRTKYYRPISAISKSR